MHMHHTQFIWIGPIAANVTMGLKDLNLFLQIDRAVNTSLFSLN